MAHQKKEKEAKKKNQKKHYQNRMMILMILTIPHSQGTPILRLNSKLIALPKMNDLSSYIYLWSILDYSASESDGDSEDEEESSSSYGSQEHDDDEDIEEEGDESGSDRVLRLLQGVGIFCT